jgi:hypothetical protein
MRTPRPLAALLLTALAALCAHCQTDADVLKLPGEAVGCEPARGAAAEPENACTSDGGACFTGDEIFLATDSGECASRACMVYRWDERAHPEQRGERVFCTCKCGGAGDPSTFCQCGAGQACVTAFFSGPDDVRGAYCVPEALAREE